MKIGLLVFPRFTDTHLQNQSTHELGQRLEPSVLYLASEKEGDTNVFIQDNQPRDDIDMYLCSVYTRGYKEFQEFAAKAGRDKIIAGGYHPSAEPQDVLKYAHKVVTGITGNIEEIIHEVAPGIIKGKFSPRTMHRELVDMTRMRQVYPDVYPHMLTGSSTSSVGCPYDCSFCSTPLLSDRKMHAFDLQHVEADVADLRNRGVKAIFVRDESFATHPRFKDVVSIYATGNFDVLYSFGTAAAMTEAKFKHLADNGWHSLNMGLEDVFESYRKNKSLEQACEMAKKSGVMINLSFIVNDCGKDLKKSLQGYHMLYQAFQKYQPGMVAANFMMPFPGTGIWNQYRGLISDDDFVRYDSKTPIFSNGKAADWHKHMAVAVQLAYYYSPEYRQNVREFECGDNLHLRFVELARQFGMENGGWTKWFDPANPVHTNFDSRHDFMSDVKTADQPKLLYLE